MNSRWLTGATVVGALVGGWFLWDYVQLKAQNNPSEVGARVALAVVVVAGTWYWQESRRDALRYVPHDPPIRAADTRLHPNRAWVAPVAILVIAAAMGWLTAHDARDNYLRYYCEYGAKSSAQLDGCMEHVTTEDVNKLDTQAARFARGETSECGPDSGPYCENASKYNTLDHPDRP